MAPLSWLCVVVGASMRSPLPFTEAEQGGQSLCFAIAIIITSTRCRYITQTSYLLQLPSRTSEYSVMAKFAFWAFSEVRYPQATHKSSGLRCLLQRWPCYGDVLG